MADFSNDGATRLGEDAYTVADRLRLAVDDQPLNEELAHRHARALIWEPLRGMTIEQEYDGLREALASDHRLSTWTGDPRAEVPIDETRFRDYLHAIVRNLDAMRPWPRPLMRVLDEEIFPLHYTSPRTVGRILLPTTYVEDRIHRFMVPMDVEGSHYRVAVLELRSGREVALVGYWWKDDLDVTAVLTREVDARAAEIVAELTSGTAFAPEECEVLG